jgi:hypothetical protein
LEGSKSFGEPCSLTLIDNWTGCPTRA